MTNSIWIKIGAPEDHTYAMLVPGGMVIRFNEITSTLRSSPAMVFVPLHHECYPPSQWIEERRTEK